MTSEEIMKMTPGWELNKKVQAEVNNLINRVQGTKYPVLITSWSDSNEGALELWGLIEERIECVGMMRMGVDAPVPIRHLVTIGDTSEETGPALFVYTSDWKESLCKAFLLWEQGYRDEYFHPAWVEAKKQAEKRVIN